MGLWATYSTLNAEQKRILRAKSVSANRHIDPLIEFLKPIAAFDASSDKARTRFGCGMALGIVLVVVSIILAANDALPPPAGVALVVVIVAITIALGYGWSWTRRVDVSNNFRTFVLPVLNLLREDVHKHKTVNVKLDLRPPNIKEKLQSRSKPYARGAYYKVVESLYLDPWMSAELPLADGSEVRWRIVDRVREFKKTKKNPRGKIKTKTKYKTLTKMEIEITLRNDTYTVAVNAAEDVRRSDQKTTIRIKDRQKSDVLASLTPTRFIDMLAGVYQRATPPGKEA